MNSKRYSTTQLRDAIFNYMDHMNFSLEQAVHQVNFKASIALTGDVNADYVYTNEVNEIKKEILAKMESSPFGTLAKRRAFAKKLSAIKEFKDELRGVK